MSTQTKLDALRVLMWDARRETSSSASYKKVSRALKTLGFAGDDYNNALYLHGYADTDGKPFAWTSPPRKSK